MTDGAWGYKIKSEIQATNLTFTGLRISNSVAVPLKIPLKYFTIQ